MTCMPAAAQPATKLSAAMLLSAVASTGFRPLVTQSLINRTAVVVFPDPGGPWISVTLRLVAACNASYCDWLMFHKTGEPDGKPPPGGKWPQKAATRSWPPSSSAARSARLSQSNSPGAVQSTRRAFTWRQKVTWLAARSILHVFPTSSFTAAPVAPITLTTMPTCGCGKKDTNSASKLVGWPPLSCRRTRAMCGVVMKIQSPAEKLWPLGSSPEVGFRMSSQSGPRPGAMVMFDMQLPFRSKI
mmetsp:Transcript_28973/g.96477  ORF Transcript_28973/g.96477 Transcript_28973/m.96477 type:complete len:244 (+) Transcript_28973:1512-2243(+)